MNKCALCHVVTDELTEVVVEKDWSYQVVYKACDVCKKSVEKVEIKND